MSRFYLVSQLHAHHSRHHTSVLKKHLHIPGQLQIFLPMNLLLAKNLFHKAIPQSGATHHVSTERQANQVASDLAKNLGWKHEEMTLEKLQKVPASVLFKAITKVSSAGMAWQPTLAAPVLPVSPFKAIQDSHDSGITDEFIKPIIFSEYSGIKGTDDSLIFCNFRADRARQILHALTDKNFISFLRPNERMFNKAVGMIEYDTDFKQKFNVLFEKQEIKNGLGEWVSRNGLKQFRIAETEKYPHVTYFLNGGSEYEYEGEERSLVPSPQVKGYEQKPQMSAEKVCDNLISALERNFFDLLIVNFANPDMVGHTGNLSAAKVAVETVDEMLGKICTCLDSVGGEALIISDHGNCEQMYIGDTENPHTYHTLNPVPCILYSDREKVSISSGSLIDIAPTILELLGKDKPNQMTGKSLLQW